MSSSSRWATTPIRRSFWPGLGTMRRPCCTCVVRRHASARQASPSAVRDARPSVVLTWHVSWPRRRCGARLNVISGHAPGADLAAHQGAVEAGGVTILVLPEGILQFRLNAELRATFEQTPDRFVVVSEFPPRMPWSTRNAMIRNNTILGLARGACRHRSGRERRHAGSRTTGAETRSAVLCAGLCPTCRHRPAATVFCALKARAQLPLVRMVRCNCPTWISLFPTLRLSHRRDDPPGGQLRLF